MHSVIGAFRVDVKRPVISMVLTLIGVLGVFVGFAVWAISSPVGSSPDDDYHLASIWCPRPIGDSGCQTVVENGEVASVSVPESVNKSGTCLAFHPEKNALCTEQLSDDRDVYAGWFDTGQYPVGYYQFHHLFVGPDVHRSVVIMRLVNILIGLGGIVGVAVLSTPQIRHRILVSAIVAWTPMGVYFIGSNNPSSWAISGCFIYASALIASTEARGRRRGGLLAFAVFGAMLAAMSRGDSSFFVFVITLAVWFFVKIDRQQRVPFIFSLVLTVGALISFLSTGQAADITGNAGWPVDSNDSLFRIFLINLNSLPDYVATFWGLGFGPGWVDVPLSSWTTLGMIFLAGGVVLVGAREIYWRKGLASLIAFGALVGVPLVSMTIRRVHPLTYYQGRYMLPLLAVFLLLWLARKKGKSFVDTPGQMIGLVGMASAANAFALRRLITRYSIGIGSGWAGGLDAPAWWPWALPPKAMLLLGAIAMMIGIASLAVISLQGLKHSAATGRTRGGGEHVTVAAGALSD